MCVCGWKKNKLNSETLKHVRTLGGNSIDKDVTVITQSANEKWNI